MRIRRVPAQRRLDAQEGDQPAASGVAARGVRERRGNVRGDCRQEEGGESVRIKTRPRQRRRYRSKAAMAGVSRSTAAYGWLTHSRSLAHRVDVERVLQDGVDVAASRAVQHQLHLVLKRHA